MNSALKKEFNFFKGLQETICKKTTKKIEYFKKNSEPYFSIKL